MPSLYIQMRDLWQVGDSGQLCRFGSTSERYSLRMASNVSSNQSLTYVCTIGLFKAAAAARRRLFNESLYGVCPMGVPEALLTSCEGTVLAPK